MSLPTRVSIDEYLRNSYPDLDREYVHGEVVERTMPDWYHARLQGFLAYLFQQLEERYAILGALSLRLRLAPELVRIPDFCVYREVCPNPHEVASIPPYLIVEILSPDDRLPAVLAKCAEYQAFGVAHIWAIDPLARTFAAYQDSQLHPVPALTLPGYPLVLTSALFDRL